MARQPSGARPAGEARLPLQDLDAAVQVWLKTCRLPEPHAFVALRMSATYTPIRLLAGQLPPTAQAHLQGGLCAAPDGGVANEACLGVAPKRQLLAPVFHGAAGLAQLPRLIKALEVKQEGREGLGSVSALLMSRPILEPHGWLVLSALVLACPR